LIATKSIEYETKIGEVKDITDDVNGQIARSSIKFGIVLIFVPGSTASVTTIEFEDGLVVDLARALQRIAPEGIDYVHNERWHDGNGHSHIRASLFGPSTAIPFSEGRMMLGTWQQVVLLELDSKPRRRRVILQIMGD
jgi:secondary thiamine-phosphate synthase enzyme